MCDLRISIEQRDAINYITMVQNTRKKVASQVRKLHKSIIANGNDHTVAKMICTRAIRRANVPCKVTEIWIMNEIESNLESIGHIESMENAHSDEEYAYCGLDDDMYDELENKRRWVKVLRAMLEFI